MSTCLGLLVALSACGGGGGSSTGSKRLDLVIGNALPLSGASKALGESGRKASSLAVAQIKSAIAATGSPHSVKTVQRDEGRDAAAASQAAGNLVRQGRASCLTGPWSADGVERVARDVTVPSKVLQIAPVPANTSITELNDNDLVNSTALPESEEGAALSTAIERDLGGAHGRTVNVAASSDSYGSTLKQDFVEDWQDKDGSVGGPLVFAPPPPGGSSTDSAEASQIVGGNPSAVLVISGLAGFSQLVPALSSTPGWNARTAWGSDQLVSPGLPDLVGPGAIDGMRVLAPGAPQNEDASAAFVREFKAAAPRNVKLAPFAAQEFDATVLCYLAAVAAGSTDGQKMADKLIDITAPGGAKFSWQQLPEAIRALEQGKDIDYTGASGALDLDVHGNPTSGVFGIYRYTGSRLEAVGEVPVEKPNPATP
jgi:branched-chain amino acid transport system substrate-binding protein